MYRNALIHSRLAAETGEGLPLAKLEAIGLTRRQAEVLALLATDQTAAEAAITLGISVRTVHKHLEGCYRALGVSGRTDASRVAWAAVGRPGDSS
jgi:DNA-binding CsgD family transcriptional regulator